MKRKVTLRVPLNIFALIILFILSAAFAAPFSASPSINSATVEPTKVTPGSIMSVSASVMDTYGVSSVIAEMPHENGSDIINLSLFSGTSYNGTWAGQWLVHDTAVKNYTTEITAKNALGKENNYFVEWSDPWYNSAWPYRRAITLSPATSTAGYQVLVTTDTATPISQSKMQSGCQDIRFTGSDGITLQDYWIESGCNTGSTKIWVKVANSGTSTIYMYYGNAGAGAVSNGNNVFEFFDDFEDGVLDISKWDYYLATETGGYLYASTNGNGWRGAISRQSFGVGYILENAVQYIGDFGDQGDAAFGWFENWIGGQTVSFTQMGETGNNWNIHKRQNNGAGTTITSCGYSVPAYFDYSKITRKDTSSSEYLVQSGGPVCTGTSSSYTPTINLKILFATSDSMSCCYGSTEIKVYWVRVRKYASPEPSASVGPELAHTTSLASVSNNAPNPIKGGNTFTITPSGQADTISDSLRFYCRLDAGGATSANTVCSQGNTAYSSPYSGMACTVTAPSDRATHTYYCRVFDDIMYSSPERTTSVSTAAEVLLASVSNNAPNPIKGGTAFTITPSGQSNSFLDNLYFYCRLDASGATSGNTACSEGNTAYSAPYSSMKCTAAAPLDKLTHTYYCRVYDGTAYSSPERTTGITSATDVSPPNTGTISIYGGLHRVTTATPVFNISTTDVGTAGMGYMEFSCDNSQWTSPMPYVTSYSSFNIKSGYNGCGKNDGERTVYVRFRDLDGNIQLITANTGAFTVDTSGLACRVTNQPCNSPNVTVFRMFNTLNSHAGTASALYPYSVCCSDSSNSLTVSIWSTVEENRCNPQTQGRVIALSDTYNAHAEKYGLSGYNTNICLSSIVSDITCGTSNLCADDEICLASISGDTNAHVGDCLAYQKKICCKTYEGGRSTYASGDINLRVGEEGLAIVKVENPLSVPDTFTLELFGAPQKIAYWSWFDGHRYDGKKTKITVNVGPEKSANVAIKVFGGEASASASILYVRINSAATGASTEIAKNVYITYDTEGAFVQTPEFGWSVYALIGLAGAILLILI